MEKGAVGKQIGGFMQTRSKTRPYRVDTLLQKDFNTTPSEAFHNPIHDAERKYEQSLAVDEGGEEFEKTSSKLRSSVDLTARRRK